MHVAALLLSAGLSIHEYSSMMDQSVLQEQWMTDTTKDEGYHM